MGWLCECIEFMCWVRRDGKAGRMTIVTETGCIYGGYFIFNPIRCDPFADKIIWRSPCLQTCEMYYRFHTSRPVSPHEKRRGAMYERWLCSSLRDGWIAKCSTEIIMRTGEWRARTCEVRGSGRRAEEQPKSGLNVIHHRLKCSVVRHLLDTSINGSQREREREIPTNCWTE